jgi:hypothetical protein
LVIKSLLDRGISLYRIRTSIERARVAGVENPLAKFRVACLANSVLFKRGKTFIDPISGQMVIEQVVQTIKPRLKRDIISTIDTILNQADNNFMINIGAY